MKNSQESSKVARQSDNRATSKHDVNLRKNNVVHFQVGLILALILAIIVIELKSPLLAQEPPKMNDVAVVSFNDDWNEPIRREIKKPEAPKPVVVSLDVPPIVDEELPETLELEIETPEPTSEAPDLTDIEPVPDDEPVVWVPFMAVETVPVFPGCEGLKSNAERKACMQEKMNAHISKNFDTSLGDKFGLKGMNKVDVQFTIDEYGEIIDLQTRAPHPALEKEAIRVMEKLPSMEPGKQRDRKVRVIYSQPIWFKVQN